MYLVKTLAIMFHMAQFPWKIHFRKVHLNEGRFDHISDLCMAYVAFYKAKLSFQLPLCTFLGFDVRK